MAQIHVLDCNGTTRAFRNVAVGGKAEIGIKVVDNAQNLVKGVKVKLVNNSGTELSSLTSAGIATFPDVPSGTWVISADQKNYFFSDITISDIAPPWMTDTAIVGGSIAGAGVVTGAIAASGGFGGGSSSTNNVVVIPTPASTPYCPTCNPDDPAPSVPPFGLAGNKRVTIDFKDRAASKGPRPLMLGLTGVRAAQPVAAPRRIEFAGTRSKFSPLAPSSIAKSSSENRLGSLASKFSPRRKQQSTDK